MRMNLQVPFAEKDQAKKLGARWDAALKVSYVAAEIDLAPFARWQPTASTASTAPAKAAKTGAMRVESSGKVIVGAAFVDAAPECACPPWETCKHCEAYACKNNA